MSRRFGMNPLRFFICTACLLLPITLAAQPMTDDPYLWLEDVTGERALAWVRERNADPRRRWRRGPTTPPLRAACSAMLRLDATASRTSRAAATGFYNLWQDDDNPRGLWRRTTLAEYRKAEAGLGDACSTSTRSARPRRRTGSGSGAQCLGPEYRRCLVSLSRGGADATVVREFDTVAKRFVEGRASSLPEAKSSVDWNDDDTRLRRHRLRPRLADRLRLPAHRQALEPRHAARRRDDGVRRHEASDVAVGVIGRPHAWLRAHDRRPRDRLLRRSERYLLRGSGKLVRDRHADDAKLGFRRDTMLVELRSDWKLGGQHLSRRRAARVDADAYLAGERELRRALRRRRATRSLAGLHHDAQSRASSTMLDNVASRLEEWTAAARDAKWHAARRHHGALPRHAGVAGAARPAC